MMERIHSPLQLQLDCMDSLLPHLCTSLQIVLASGDCIPNCYLVLFLEVVVVVLSCPSCCSSFSSLETSFVASSVFVLVLVLSSVLVESWEQSFISDSTAHLG